MKKAVVLSLLLVGLFVHVPAFAFLYDENPSLTIEQIKALSDADLIKTYIDAKIELDASRTFHGKAGFTPKEYNLHKELMHFIVSLRLEMQLRELEAPPVDEWFR